jgi:hypothetical protein
VPNTWQVWNILPRSIGIVKKKTVDRRYTGPSPKSLPVRRRQWTNRSRQQTPNPKSSKMTTYLPMKASAVRLNHTSPYSGEVKGTIKIALLNSSIRKYGVVGIPPLSLSSDPWVRFGISLPPLLLISPSSANYLRIRTTWGWISVDFCKLSDTTHACVWRESRRTEKRHASILTMCT